MGIISSIASLAANSLKHGVTKAHKSDVLNYFSNEEQVLSVYLDSIDSVLLDKVVENLKNKTDPTIQIGRKAYDEYVRALPSGLANKERTAPFSTIVETISILDKNEKIVLDSYLSMFNQSGNDISWENIRFTQVLIMSYFARAADFMTWAFYLTMYLVPTEDVAIPPYRKAFLEAHTKESASYADLTISHAADTIDKRVDAIRHTGKDLVVYNDGVSMDQYVDDSILDADDEATLSNVMRNPLAMFISWRENRRQDKIEQIRSRINWLRAKVTQQAMIAARADSDSEEYKRSAVLLQKYSDILSAYDRKLEKELN